MFRERPGSVDEEPGHREPIPIFVVGVSRSGKSLMEALLSQHEAAYGGGEGFGLIDAVRTVRDRHSISASFPGCMAFLRDEHIREIGDLYREESCRYSPKSRYIVNTLPLYYKYIGLIFQALPMARIIYCHRDPFDNCLFIYFSRYNRGNLYAYDLRSIASYYAGYREMMAHWQTLYGERIRDVRYEELVGNPVATGARIYRFCGLEGEPTIRRAAVTTEEIGHWKHYQPYLGALLQALEAMPAAANAPGSGLRTAH